MTSEKPLRTFISYSRVDKDFAVKLANELRSSGFAIWLDILDIPTGSRWDDEVERALDACEIFMVILTPASSTSDNVKDEIGYALDSGKRILPVLLENAKVPLRLRRLQYVDFTSKSYDEGVEGAKQLLKSLIEEPMFTRTEIPAVSQTQKAKEEPERMVRLKVEEEQIAKEKQDLKEQHLHAKVQLPKPALVTHKTEAGSVPSRKKSSLPLKTVIAIVAVLGIVGVIGSNALKESPKVLSVDEAKQLGDIISILGFYELAQIQHTEAELQGFEDNNRPIPLNLPSSIPLRLGFSVCAASQDVLEEIFLDHKFIYTLDGKTIPVSNHGTVDYSRDVGGVCRTHYVIITDWKSGKYLVSQSVVLTQTIDDGYKVVDPFTTFQEFQVTIP